ncbi:MAG: hypothetical protein WA988_13140 [Candidatus Nanopelagicales bacterium]
MSLSATGYVELEWKRNRLYPWPEDSWGLTPMFGEGGWCHACGTPKREQTGSIVLQRRSGNTYTGAWVPNWRFDVICIEQSLAAVISQRFRVTMIPVEWRGDQKKSSAMQLVIPSVGRAWFDPTEVRSRAVERHGVDGARCVECGVWRWMPLSLKMLPAPEPSGSWDGFDAVASPEWFGDGWKSFRQILVRAELAELLHAHSSRDLTINPVVPE